MTQPLPLFVCNFGERTLNSDDQTPLSHHLPEIVHPIVLTTLLMIGHALHPVGATPTVQDSPRHQPLPPLTPPPRSVRPARLHLSALS
ncbi:MAG: hypothetical protein J7455_18715 [Roseiflexus sp.]|jgi:hypothetical protein|nr:hypothetical protein [Roseiflexus sp.]MBO9366034.1 hypothetical protein [Roseiflexus sp.]MBO9387541.1 hypothetical protein [Roseiflexus sp.]